MINNQQVFILLLNCAHLLYLIFSWLFTTVTSGLGLLRVSPSLSTQIHSGCSLSLWLSQPSTDSSLHYS